MLAGLCMGLAALASFAIGHLRTGACLGLGIAMVWAWSQPLRAWVRRKDASLRWPANLVFIEEDSWQDGPLPPAPPLDPPPPEPPPKSGTGGSKRKSPELQKQLVVGSVNVDGLTRSKEIRLEELVLRREHDMIVVQELQAPG